MQGRIFTDPSCPELCPADRRRVYQAFPATLAALHSVRPADVGLLSYGRAGGYAERQVLLHCQHPCTGHRSLQSQVSRHGHGALASL